MTLVRALATAAAVALVAPAAASGAVLQNAVVADTSYSCVTCHIDMRREFGLGVHAERGIHCDDCHGGDPTSFEIDGAHRAGFIGVPDKVETLELCAGCHSDPNRMRPFGLPAGEFDAFRSSGHGQLLLRDRDFDAPTCTDCHNAHTIRRPDDARSEVHPTNISTTCRQCHDNSDLMNRYGLEVGQGEQWQEGPHGRAVMVDLNFAAPTCIGCHGSHSALPPGISEVVDVCSHCHVLVGRAFRRGPHAAGAESETGAVCLGCHDNHLAQTIAASAAAGTCLECHESGDPAATLGVDLRQRLVEADSNLADAREAIEELVRAGRSVDDERFRYQSAVTYRLRMAAAQHGLNQEELDDLGTRLRSVTGGIRSQAEARAEQLWEHKLFLIPIWFLALSGVAFAVFKLREESG